MLILCARSFRCKVYVIIDNAYYYMDDITSWWDGLITLQNLAKFHREFLNIPIIALTGSNGKQQPRTYSSCSSFNTKQQLGI
jgi:UDP-N-acetylmuramoyl-tripeptide--D-alanyl-D-alanine ligase